jgi:hypothetical protein
MSDLASLAALGAQAINSLNAAKALYEVAALDDNLARVRLNSCQAVRDACVASVQAATPNSSETYVNVDGYTAIGWSVGASPIVCWSDPSGKQLPNAGEALANYLTLFPNVVS